MSATSKCGTCPRVTRERRKLWNMLMHLFTWRRLRCEVDGQFVGRDDCCHLSGDQLRAVSEDARRKAQIADEGG